MKTKHQTNIIFVFLLGIVLNFISGCTKDNTSSQWTGGTVTDYEGNVLLFRDP